MTTIHIKRVTNLLKRQIIFNANSILLGLLAICGPVIFVSLLYINFKNSSVIGLQGFFMTLFFFGGYIFSSRIFTELKTTGHAYGYLTLPASNLEKLLVAWLLSSPVFILVYTFFLFLLLQLSNLTTNQYAEAGSLFGVAYWRLIGIYITTQPVFILGASYFKKHNFLKTILAIFLFQMSVLFILGIVGYFLFSDASMGSNINYDPDINCPIPGEVFKPLFLTLCGLFFMIVSYFKLKEREI